VVFLGASNLDTLGVLSCLLCIRVAATMFFYQDTWFWLIFHLFIEGCVDVVWFCFSGFVFCEVMYLAIPKKKRHFVHLEENSILYS